MKIFFSLGSIHPMLNNLFKSNRNNRIIALICRLLLVFIALVVLRIVMIKVYEVPVNYTEFHVIRDGALNDGELHLFLIRDYDRKKESSNNNYIRDRERKGGFYVEGFFHNKSKDTIHTNSNLSNEKQLLRGKRYSEIIDTAKYDYTRIRSNVVYMMMMGTRRQELFPKDQDFDYSREYFNTEIDMNTDYYHYGRYSDNITEEMDSNNTHHVMIPAIFLNSKYCKREVWKIPMDSVFVYSRIRANRQGVCKESFTFSSEKDSVAPCFMDITGDPFEKPNPFLVAEDVSKMVEILRIPLSSHSFVKSITIDYRCPAEFGFLVPEPDERTMSSIRYTDSLKILKIAVDGLEYHVKFPDMENIQEVRLFGLTAIITILLSVFASLLYKLFTRHVIRKWYKNPTFSILSTITILTLSLILLFLFARSSVNYNNLKFDTFDNGKEWEGIEVNK